MASSSAIRAVPRQVRKILSTDKNEARRRVMNLYKAWYRHAPFIVLDYDIPKSIEDIREKVREQFEKNQHVEDVRVIDLLVIKGQMELNEVVNKWKQRHGVLNYWNDSIQQKPKDFLSKFLDGH